MPKKKLGSFQKKGLTPVHLQTVFFLVLYYIFSNLIFFSLVTHPNVYISYIGPFIFSIASGFVFLYLFSHKDFFSFAGLLEKAEHKKEENYLDRFLKYGKYIACILVSQFGGPIFLALTIRFLFPPNTNRYLVVFYSTIASTLFGVAVAKGLLTLW